MNRLYRTLRITCICVLASSAASSVAMAQTGTLFVRSGKVGIGTDTPSEVLHVKSSTPGNTLVFVENTSGPERVGSRYSNSLATWDFRMDAAGNFIFDNTATGGEDLNIQKSGQLRVGPAPAKILLQPNGDIDIEGTLHEGSSRASKNRFELLDPRDVLQRVVGMDVLEWSYRDQQSRHIGPMAEDFHSLFGLGHSDKSLAPRDLAGVTLLALQGLNEVVQEKDHQIDQLRREVAELKAMVEALGPQEPRSGSTTDR